MYLFMWIMLFVVIGVMFISIASYTIENNGEPYISVPCLIFHFIVCVIWVSTYELKYPHSPIVTTETYTVKTIVENKPIIIVNGEPRNALSYVNELLEEGDVLEYSKKTYPSFLLIEPIVEEVQWRILPSQTTDEQ